ncbi:uncharacterized protein LOC128997370 [Macrosteles quadrilineatus]|uniref:uncharacterized protein LOC128997370 n=1 Tax=Macrosteles quadrilineatus TaxID=74068 RepID=UPI0023E15557|nr:uncharacterized protein LOC128997370 [Macrosteles quadrilineatus]
MHDVIPSMKKQESIRTTLNELKSRFVQLEEHITGYSLLNPSQEQQPTDLNELAQRVARLEEFTDVYGYSTRNEYSDIDIDRSQLAELSKKVDIIYDKLAFNEQFSTEDSFARSYFRQMMMSISMPGLKFIGERHKSWFHAYMWILFHAIALLISSIYIKEEYHNWQRSPVVRTISNNLTYVNEIPFPAISICLAPSLNNSYDYNGNLEKCFFCNSTGQTGECDFNSVCDFDEKATLAFASSICRNSSNGQLSGNPWFVFEEEIQSFLKNDEYSRFSKKVFPMCEFMITRERKAHDSTYKIMQYYDLSCYENVFQHFISGSGMCFTINGLKHEDIYKETTVLSLPLKRGSCTGHGYRGANFTLENMIYFNGNNETIPAYMSDDHVITFRISERRQGKYFCNPNKQDVGRFAIHNPVDVPFIFENKLMIAEGEGLHIRVIPELVTTEADLENHLPTARGCYYSHERGLSMFKYYSERNCEAECVANCSLQMCGCVPYFLPRHNSSVNVCLSLCSRARSCDCQCLPDCTSLTYEFESLKVYGKDYTGILYISFKKSGFYSTLRVSFTNLAQFMAYCFGIVGVFNGFSIMMFCEVFYFFTFKLWESVHALRR